MNSPRNRLRVQPAPIPRIPILDVAPVAEAGRYPAKTTVGEPFPISATVVREGHDALGTEAVLLRADGTEAERVRLTEVGSGLDRYEAWAVADEPGSWTFRVESWSDPWATWVHDASIKVPAGIDIEFMLTTGAQILQRAAQRRGPQAPDRDTRTLLRAAADEVSDLTRSASQRLDTALAESVRLAFERFPIRDLRSASPDYPLQVDRPLAVSGAWYEIFPRSIGAYLDDTGSWVSGTLLTAAEDLPRIAGMGFDIVYLTPIHPIGTTFRKGRNNSLEAGPNDPGSPYAIGSAEGGHDAIDPVLGTFDDFDVFVSRARELGMEVALDLALQCSPDHPWVVEHPEWFAHRADGSIAYAENPPKKYQDIYPLSFDTDPNGLRTEIRRVLEVWISHGVTAFRVDNPHTKPLTFWQALLTDIRTAHPDVIFLSEAFTRPAMMLALAKSGFHQSYTYFAWRNTKAELEEYLATVASEQGAWMRPSFWPTTHDILTPYMQEGGVGAFAIRAILAALGAPTWGIYTGYELVENIPRPGVEEQIDNEKYEYRPRNWATGDDYGIALLLGRLNAIRRAHPALRQLRRAQVHQTDNPQLVCFSRYLAAEHSPNGKADTVVTVVNLDPHHPQDGWIDLDLTAWGFADDHDFTAIDELSGEIHQWGPRVFVRLDPAISCAHVVSVNPS